MTYSYFTSFAAEIIIGKVYAKDRKGAYNHYCSLIAQRATNIRQLNKAIMDRIAKTC